MTAPRAETVRQTVVTRRLQLWARTANGLRGSQCHSGGDRDGLRTFRFTQLCSSEITNGSRSRLFLGKVTSLKLSVREAKA
jgi:hypothetical protein